ncbi:putative disease resistance protein [Trifolium repens]|nr:putative disease resistance protein [Trifolium repens]
MATFLCDLVKSYVEKLIDGAIAEARHVFCFTCIVKEFEEERARLEPERITMVQRIKVAKERDKDIEANVGSWAEEIDKLNQVDTKTKQTCFFEFCPDCIWRYKKGKELANNMEKIKRLVEKGEKLENIELPHRLPDVERYSSKDYISFRSREEKYKELLDALKDDNNYITGLQGMGGTGKTTLAKEVGKKLKQSENFAYVVDTTVSFTPDVKKIQDDIAGSLGLKWEDCNESDRPKKLWSRLTNGDKILVILDDVWDRGPRLDFEAIGIPKQDNHKGCRVLVTSRSKITFNIMDCHKTIELGLLSTEDTWIMFEWYAGICNSSSKILINKARKIAKECKQLPVAISVIASSLKGQQDREHEWDVTLKSLKQPVSMHGVDDDMVGIYNCLKISYDNLKDEKAKGLFLLCSVFREDEEYFVEVLTRLCIGVGVLGEDYGSYDDARNQVVVAKNKLVDSCLLLEEITLPELQRYHIKNLPKYLNLEGTKFPKYVVFKGYEARQFSEETLKYCIQTADALSLHGIKGEWRNLMPEIVSVEPNGMNDLVELHLVGISQLRCLIDTTGCSQAPNVLSKLVVLKLEDMENLEELFNGTLSFESLNNLEKLSIKNCKHLRSLFKGKLNLCNLKTITLLSCPMLVSLFEVSTSRSLVLLETLQIVNCQGLETIIADERREDEEIDDGDNNNKSHGSMFSKLKVINIESCHRLESLLPNFIGIFEECYDPMSSCVKVSYSTSKYGSKAQIQLDPIKCNTFSWWTHICCQTRIPLVDVDGDQRHECSMASETNSYGLNIWKRAQYIPIKSKILCNIKEIKLTCLPKMKSVFILSIAPTMQLETLKIMNCDELKHIIIDIGDHNTSGNNWVNVFPKLKELYVKGCPQLEYIFGHDTSDHQNHMEIQLHLPELRDVFLVNLPSLVAMCPKQYRTTYPSLKTLELKKCSQVDIKSVFHSVSESLDSTIIKELSGNVDHFLTLENLVVDNSKVENIFSPNEIDGQQLSLGLKYILLYDLPMMTCLFVGPKNSFSLRNLTCIKIVRCEKLKTAFSTSILRFLPQLVYLRIEECKELEHIIEDDDDLENKKISNSLSSRSCFPKLEVLSVAKCNKMKYFFPFSVCKELPKLKFLVINEASELEEIFKSEDDQKVDIPNLYIVAFDMLPSLCCAQGNQFQAVKNRVVTNCQKLTLTSASTANFTEGFVDISSELTQIMSSLSEHESDLASVENAGIGQLPSAETTEDFELPSVENFPSLTILPTNSELKGSPSEKTLVATLSTISGTKNEPLIQVVASKQKGIEIEGTSETNNDQVSINDDAFMKVNPNAEEQFSKDDEIISSKSKPSSSITSPISSQFPSMPSNGDPSQKVEDLAILPTNSEIQIKQTPETKDEFVENIPDLAILPTNSEIQMKQTPKAEHKYVENVPELAILPTNSEELLNEQSLGETDAIVKPSQVNNLEGSTSEKTPVATVSTISRTKNEPPIQVVALKQKGIEIEGTSKTNNDQVSLNDDDAFMKVNSNVEEQFSKGDEIIVSKFEPSPSITSAIASQFPSMPSKSDPSQKVDDLNSSLLVKRELEELFFKNCLDYENLSLLTDFLVKNPSVCLKDTSLGNIYKGCAYNSLAKLLKFLKTHSLLEVSGSCHSEFLELLQGAHNFAFDKDWLDNVERRTLFPKIQVSPDTLEKLLDSKKRITKDVEDLKHQLTSSEAVLESIIQHESVLRAPIGY